MDRYAIDLDELDIDMELIRSIPYRFLEKFRAVPVASDSYHVTIAFENPNEILGLDTIQRVLHNKIIKQVSATPAEIDMVLAKIKVAIHTDNLISQINTDMQSMSNNTSMDDSSAVMELIELIFEESAKSRASDIHVEAREDSSIVRIRVDGMLREKFVFEKDIFFPLVSRVKLLASMDIAQRREPQDGRFSMLVDGREFDFRVSSLPTVLGESVVIRALDKERMLIELADAGMSKNNYKIFYKAISKPYGMVLVTGPTGSGKTTTLYGAINTIQEAKDKIITVEDPVEYQLEGIQQVQVGHGSGVDFADALRSILRQDPDKIMIGEIRDTQTLRIAVQAALTGHLVLSTLHTNSAIGAVSRIVDMGVESYLLSGALVAVEAQRLVRRVCNQCKHKVDIPKNRFNEIEKYLPKEYQLYEANGCKECQYSGYIGREMISEVLMVDEKISDLIAKGASKAKIEKQALKKGFLPMFADGVAKACRGITTLDEVYRVAKL